MSDKYGECPYCGDALTQHHPCVKALKDLPEIVLSLEDQTIRDAAIIKFQAASITTLQERIAELEGYLQKHECAAEDAESFHLYMDQNKIPRLDDEHGIELSAVGRANYYRLQGIAEQGDWVSDVRYTLECLSNQHSGKVGSTDRADCMAVLAKSAFNRIPSPPKE